MTELKASHVVSGKESACNVGEMGDGVWVRKIPLERKWQRTPIFLPRKFHGQRSLVGYSSWGHKRVGHNRVTKQQQKLIVPEMAPSVLWALKKYMFNEK